MRHMMTLLLLTMMTRGSIVAAEPKVLLDFQPLAQISEQAKTSTGPNGEPAIEVTGGQEKTAFTLIISEQPKVSSHEYQVRGFVKYNGVVGDGYLELLNYFDEPSPYFSRSLDETGPFRKLKGNSEWREFVLPFFANPGMKPKRLDLSIVLPGAGQVTITQPILEAQFPRAGEWWSSRQGNLIGAIGGSLLGILGGTLGMFMSWSRTRVIARRIYPTLLGACYIMLILGLAAVCLRQPYHVYYPLLLLGGIGALCLPIGYTKANQQVQNDELRKMSALDIN